MTKEVYNPVEDRKAAKSLIQKEGKAHMEDSKPEGKAKKEKKEKPAPKEKTPYINKYGFLHVNGKLAAHLGVEFGKDKADVPVQIEQIPRGFVVKLR